MKCKYLAPFHFSAFESYMPGVVWVKTQTGVKHRDRPFIYFEMICAEILVYILSDKFSDRGV